MLSGGSRVLPVCHQGPSTLCRVMSSGLSPSHCSHRRGYIRRGFRQFRRRCGLYPSPLPLATRWAADTVLYQEGPAVHSAGFRFQSLIVFHWIERVISDSVTDHCLRDPVAEAWYVGLAESKGTTDGEVHRICDNKDSAVDPYVLSVSLLRCLSAPYRFPFFRFEGKVLS